MDRGLTFSITNRRALFFILLISVIIVIDSTIIKFFMYTYEELPVYTNVEMFTTLFITIAIVAVILLRSVEKCDFKSNNNREVLLNRTRIIAKAGQYMVIGFLAITIFQMALLHMYNTLLVHLIVFASFVTSMLFLILLIILLAGWFISGKNYMIIAYAIAFSIICAYLTVSMIYVVLQFRYHATWIKAGSIHLSLVNLPASDLSLSFGVAVDILSIVSFVLVWTATVALLRQYTSKIGKIRFWVTISIPLIYFMFPFETYFASFFQDVLSESPIIFTVMYIILFSATKQVGGLLFSIVFLTAAAIINQRNLRNYLIIAAIGIAILFSSTEITSLLYATYPPYGALTIMLMPLGSYFLFIGLFASARFVSRDKGLRKEFFHTAEKQLTLLKSIGEVQMERELEKSLRSILKRPSIIEENNDYYQTDEDVKELVQDVLHELRSRDSRDKNTETN